MKATEWLVRATRDLPAGVTARVKADTLAHLQDAGIDRGADVRPLLGRPDDMAAELRRLYLTTAEWHGFSVPVTPDQFSDALRTFLWPALLAWALFEPLHPLHGNWWLWGTLVIGIGGFLALIQRQPPVLRRLWRDLLASWAFPATVVMLVGKPPDLIFVALSFAVYMSYTTWKRAARLARTLTLEGEQA